MTTIRKAPPQPVFDINDYFAKSPGRVRKSIVTKRGRIFSIQASSGHYCLPRNDVGPYTHVEVMVVEGSDPKPFIGFNSGRKAIDHVYGFLPVKLVEDVINRIDGGIKH